MRNILLSIQGPYFLITGVWPLIRSGTSQKVTGPKVDVWLVKTSGALISVVGAVLLWAGSKSTNPPQTAVALAAGSAAALGASDVVYVSKGRISPIFLLDALAEVTILAAWIFTLTDKGRSKRGAEIEIQTYNQ